MHRRDLLQLLGATTFAAGFGVARRASAVEHTIKLGTLAPKVSPWGQVFAVWSKAVSDKSGGRMELQISYNGLQGDEDAMVAKIKSSTLDGAAVSGVGLGKIYKPILALQMPGLFTAWSKLDKARDTMKSEFEKGASDAGFFISGWGDVGLVRAMSKGFAVKTPDDLKGKKPAYIRADAIRPAVFSVIGGVSGVPLNVPEVLPNLNTGAVNTVHAPCLVAEQLQWAGKLDNLTTNVLGVSIGAIAFSTKRLGALPADLKAILLDTAKITALSLTKRIRDEDDAAFNRLKGKMNVSTMSADEVAKWDAIHKQARQKLAQGTFSSDLVAKLEGLAA